MTHKKENTEVNLVQKPNQRTEIDIEKKLKKQIWHRNQIKEADLTQKEIKEANLAQKPN